jgi:hypothetical protein
MKQLITSGVLQQQSSIKGSTTLPLDIQGTGSDAIQIRGGPAAMVVFFLLTEMSPMELQHMVRLMFSETLPQIQIMVVLQ